MSSLASSSSAVLLLLVVAAGGDVGVVVHEPLVPDRPDLAEEEDAKATARLCIH